MRNVELFSPKCPNDHAERLVLNYVLRGLLGDNKSYRPEKLLAMQHAVYEEWLAEVHKHCPTFSCGFYEWLSRDCDAAFVLKPGDLVKYDSHYCVVVSRCPAGMGWVNSWRFRHGLPKLDPWPQRLSTVELKDPNGHRYVVNALADSIEPTDIPPEIFALACGKAKDCPMMKGGAE